MHLVHYCKVKLNFFHSKLVLYGKLAVGCGNKPIFFFFHSSEKIHLNIITISKSNKPLNKQY